MDTQNQVPVPDWQKAPIPKRLGAAFVDLLVVAVLLWVPYLNVFLVIGYSLSRDSWRKLKGQSLGKKLFGLRTIHLLSGYDLKGQYGIGITRNLTMVILPIDLLFGLFHARGQRLGDLWAQTMVVKDTAEVRAYHERVERSWRRFLDLGDHYDPLDYKPKTERKKKGRVY